jgi:hypothetical protein
LALRVHRAVERANAMLDRLQLQAGPLIARGEVIAADVQHITGTVRKDIQKISHTVGAANDRVMQAVRLTERRLNDFNTLLRMIQRELEQLFVGAAATMRGVRQGTHAFRDGPELASLEEDDDVFLDEFDYEEEEEITDADDVYDAAEDAPPIGPRIRRRR